jgi:hypothetical protein
METGSWQVAWRGWNFKAEPFARFAQYQGNEFANSVNIGDTGAACPLKADTTRIDELEPEPVVRRQRCSLLKGG